MKTGEATRREFMRRFVAGGIALCQTHSSAARRNSPLNAERKADRTPSAPLPLVTLTIRTAVRHQVIENFGASDAWSMEPIGQEWTEQNKAKLADLLFSCDKGIGLSLWRFNIGAGSAVTDSDRLWDRWRGAPCFRQTEAADYDWTRQAGQQWFLQAARDRGVTQFLACAYSPPVWMTQNGHAYCDKPGGSTNLKPGYEPAFARFLADVVAHFRDQKGIAFQFLSPLNEPNWAWEGGQEGCRYNNADILRLIRALHTELTTRRLSTEIDVPEAGDLVSLLDDARFRAWSRTSDPNAVYTGGNNALGYYALEACEKIGISVPDQLSIVGYDGLPWPAATRHTAASVAVDLDALADTAVRLLLHHMEGGAHAAREALIPATLTDGTTLARPAHASNS